jgi:predicted Rossmann-fold nucleotide-binding protein
MKIKDIIKNLENLDSVKTQKIIILCREYLSFENLINLDQNNLNFPRQDKEISLKHTITDSFLSKLATIEFGYNGWLFAGGAHKSITNNTEIQAKKFSELYGQKYGDKIPLSTGATTKFMETINDGFNKSANFAITSTTKFPIIGDKVNKEIKYCFTASTFANMETFLIHNAIAGVFFEGGIGTTYEAFSMLIERQRGSIPNNTPIIFVKRDDKDNILYSLIKMMQEHGKVYPTDLENLYSVNTAEEAIDILSKYEIFQKPKDGNDFKHEFIRQIFTVSKNRYI